nr:hypothetical protein TQ38_27860 [Novosphingobium sp. P6W]
MRLGMSLGLVIFAICTIAYVISWLGVFDFGIFKAASLELHLDASPAGMQELLRVAMISLALSLFIAIWLKWVAPWLDAGR